MCCQKSVLIQYLYFWRNLQHCDQGCLSVEKRQKISASCFSMNYCRKLFFIGKDCQNICSCCIIEILQNNSFIKITRWLQGLWRNCCEKSLQEVQLSGSLLLNGEIDFNIIFGHIWKVHNSALLFVRSFLLQFVFQNLKERKRGLCLTVPHFVTASSAP